MLTEFSNPLFYDKLLPYGRLREPHNAIYRADMVVVTKCPPQLKALEYRIFKNNLKLFPYQKLFFSAFDYGPLAALFPDEAPAPPHLSWLTSADSVMVLAGIANPKPLVRYVKEFAAKVKVKLYPDHHDYSKRDLEVISRLYGQLPGDRRLIITTEKDAVRLASNPYFPQELKSRVFYLPVKVRFDPHNVDSFDIELQKALLNSIK